jgi:transcriptional regulator with XRE-family HTH domain
MLGLWFGRGTIGLVDNISCWMPVRTFGRTVRYRRTKLGLSQAKLGELVGRSPSTVRSWERDHSRPNDPHVITTLSAILGIDERTLFEKAGQPQPEIETSPTIEQEMASLSPDTDEQPDLVEGSEPEPASVLLAEPTPQPEAVSTEVPTYVAPPETHVVTTTLPPVHEPSYMEDRSQRQLYRVRNLATIVILVALGIAFVWAFTEGLGSLGAWWDDFFGSLRL